MGSSCPKVEPKCEVRAGGAHVVHNAAQCLRRRGEVSDAKVQRARGVAGRARSSPPDPACRPGCRSRARLGKEDSLPRVVLSHSERTHRFAAHAHPARVWVRAPSSIAIGRPPRSRSPPSALSAAPARPSGRKSSSDRGPTCSPAFKF